jgi:hypothetical protein
MGDSARVGHDTGASRPTSGGGTWKTWRSEHAKTKRYTQRRGAWGDAHRAAGTHRANGTSRKRHHPVLRRAGGGARA